MARSQWTREKAVKTLMAVIEEGAPAVKISAVKELNLMHGFNAPVVTEIRGGFKPLTLNDFYEDQKNAD